MTAAEAHATVAAEAHATAAAEGLELLRAENPTGFKYVSFDSRQNHASKPFKAELRHGGRHKYLGTFATPEEAALAVARALGPEGVATALAAAAPQPTMTAAEAHATAAAEGLELLLAENVTGFKNVSRTTDCITKPFHAVVSHGGRDNHLGNFATAEEAALAVARFLGPEGVAAVLAASTPMTAAEAQAAAAEAHAAAAAEGLTLVPSAENATGFMGVVKDGGFQKPFKAVLSHGGRLNHLGQFATAEEASLAVARVLGPENVAHELAKLTPMTASEAIAAAAAEGLTLVRANNSSGFKNVSRNTGRGNYFLANVGGNYLGCFATAEEAALTIARGAGPEVVAARCAAWARAAASEQSEPGPSDATAAQRAAWCPSPSEAAPMTAAEAYAAAAAEGLTLLRSDNSTGFKHVAKQSDTLRKPYVAQPSHGGRQEYQGMFATAEEAALAVARFLARSQESSGEKPPRAAAPAAAPVASRAASMTAAECHAAAAAEGLWLVPADNATGFKGVHPNSGSFRGALWRDGSLLHLGQFATAEEAALAVARTLGPDGLALEAEALAAPMTAAEALAAAEAEGLTLKRAANTTGYKYVGMSGRTKNPYNATVNGAGYEVHIGNFATAEEAALAVARHSGPEVIAKRHAAWRAAAAAPAPAAAAAAPAAAAPRGAEKWGCSCLDSASTAPQPPPGPPQPPPVWRAEMRSQLALPVNPTGDKRATAGSRRRTPTGRPPGTGRSRGKAGRRGRA